MTTTDTTSTAIDTAALAHAIEARDAETVTALYAEDADPHHARPRPPAVAPAGVHAAVRRSAPTTGRSAAATSTTRSSDAVSTATGLGFTQHCRYPDGTRVVCTAVATVRDGRIVSQTGVQVWE